MSARPDAAARHGWTRGGPPARPAGAALALLLVSLLPAAAQRPGELDRFLDRCPPFEGRERTQEDPLRFSDQCIPLAEQPNRPKGIVELGEPFLGTGTLSRGFRIPGGAVWQPAFIGFGDIRTGAQGGQPATGATLGEAAARFDLFGNLYLTQTERIVIGIRPLDRDGAFTRFTFADPSGDADATGFSHELNATIRTLFFEGDLASLFPVLDLHDRRGLDIYFSLGRQALAFQDGILLNVDGMDMLGLTRANMKIGRAGNTRVTGVFGWNGIHRHGPTGNVRDDSALLFGLFSETDNRATTFEVDAIYVQGDAESGNGIHAGIADIRRFGRRANTLRVVASAPVGAQTPFNRAGLLIHNQLGWTPAGSHDWWYIGAFAGIQEFRSAARSPGFGGPLGQTGVLFAGPGLGRVGSALGSFSDHAVGASFGRQRFFDHTRKQLVVEVGGRLSTSADAPGGHGLGAGARYQAAMGRRLVLVLDGTAAYDLTRESMAALVRLELLMKL
jgi:hypothetical protein